MPLRLSKTRMLLDGIPLNEGKGADVASASTIDIWSATGNLVPITGTATIAAFSVAPQAGAKRTLLCVSTPAFTHGVNFLLPGSADYTATAGDRIEVLAVTTTQFRLSILKASVLADVSLATDASGNTVPTGSDGKYTGTPGTILTVGTNARFSTLDDALAYRDTVGHIAVATGLTGTITYTAGIDS